MDCAGVCSNNYGGGTYGATVETYYLDSDNDGWGNGGSSFEYCTALLNETSPAATAGYVDNDLDINDGTYCVSNYFDCADVCDGEDTVDECGMCGGEGIAEGACDCAGNVADCTGECGGDETNYFYYYDEDNDGHLLPYGNLCSGIPEEAGEIVVLNLVTCDDTVTEEECTAELDIDDNCSCDSNLNTEEGCYDDCGICNGFGANNVFINGQLYIQSCVGNSTPGGNCTNNSSKTEELFVQFPPGVLLPTQD
jgi:hypothetical protein